MQREAKRSHYAQPFAFHVCAHFYPPKHGEWKRSKKRYSHSCRV